MPDTITVIRARCPVCHKAATNFLAWPVGGALLTCPVCGNHFAPDISFIEVFYNPVK